MEGEVKPYFCQYWENIFRRENEGTSACCGPKEMEHESVEEEDTMEDTEVSDPLKAMLHAISTPSFTTSILEICLKLP